MKMWQWSPMENETHCDISLFSLWPRIVACGYLALLRPVV